MSTLHEWLATESAWWWPRVADHLWQASLFALFVFAASFALRSGPAKFRHAFWMMASLKLVLPAALLSLIAEQAGANFLGSIFSTIQPGPEASLFHGLSEPVAIISNNYQFTVTAGRAAAHNELYCALTAVWAIGGLTLTLLWWTRRRRFMQALEVAQPVDRGREWLAFNRASALLGSRRRIDLVLSQQKSEPAVGRIWKPVVMLPDSIGEHLNDRELEAIMLHELVHVQRHDNLIGNLQMAVLALFWFHPLVWLISRRLINEREQACDEKVLEVGGAPEAYASSILKVVRFSFGWKMAGVSGAGNGSNLRRRVKNIMSAQNSNRRDTGTRLLAGALMTVALVLMVIMGANTRARAIAVVEDTFAPISPAHIVLPQDAKPIVKDAQPPLPPQPGQPTQPSQPPQPPQLAAVPGQPVQPSQPTQPTQPSQPSQPSQPAPETPPAPAAGSTAPLPASPPVPPAPAQQNKRENQQIDEKVKLIEAPQPVYPTEARKDQVTGTVTVAIEIGEHGNILSAKATRGPEPLRSAAVEAAYKARFMPLKVNRKPTKVNAALSYNFVITDPDC